MRLRRVTAAENFGARGNQGTRREMPSPIGHSIGGYVAGRLADPRERLSRRAAAILGGFLGVLPDFDFIPGILAGDPGTYHRGISHSLGAAVLVAAAVAFVGRIWLGDFRTPFLIAVAAYGSHLVLDAIMPDTRGIAGVPLFWPLSEEYVGYALPVPWRVRYVLDLQIGDDVAGFFGILLRPRTFLALALETVLFLPLLALPPLLSRRRAAGQVGIREKSRDPGTPEPPCRSSSRTRPSGDRRGASD